MHLKEFQQNTLKPHKMGGIDSETQFKYSKGRKYHPVIQGPYFKIPIYRAKRSQQGMWQ